MTEKIKKLFKKNGKPKRKAERDKKGIRVSDSRLLRWIILMILSLVFSVMLFPNALFRPKIYKLGDVAETDIKASHDILIENKDLTEKDRQKAANDVPHVYDFDPTASDLVFRVKEAFLEGRQHATPIEQGQAGADTDRLISPESQPELDENFKEKYFEVLGIPSNDKIFSDLEKMKFPVEVEENIVSLISPIIEKGVVGNKTLLMDQVQKGIILQSIHTQEETLVTDLDRFYDVGDAQKYLINQRISLRKKTSSHQIADSAIGIASLLIKPNVTFNKRETEVRKDLAMDAVKPFYYRIVKDEMLVREGERIGPEQLLKLSAEASYMNQTKVLGRIPGMTFLIGILLSALYLAGLLEFKKSSEGRELVFGALTLLTLFIFVWAYDFIAQEIARGFYFFTPKALNFAIPVACGAMLIAVFQGMRMAVGFSLVISILAALIMESRVEFFLYFFISSLIAAFGVRYYRERGILIKTGLKVGLVNIFLSLSIEMYYGSLYSAEALISLVAGFIGGILAGVISTGIIPLVEMSFGFTTDIKLLELANLDQPLLRELMVQAPGTYHHSVIVSNMVEATAEAINANPLLAKVSAYYHDIGKMKKPQYFIENQGGGENRHEKLAPSMSSLVLISHVKDGVELARKHKLGREIIDIIQQHQGKNLISFFFQKAKEQAESKGMKPNQIKEEDFRYPGPKPQTKEAGLVMLADMVEAASRSLADPTPARIQGVVQKIINKVFSDGQLDECELTLKDLHEIAKSFNTTLSGIFHHRIEYPDNNSKNSKKTGNGYIDQVSTEDSAVKRPEDTASNGEGLKRLGL